MTTADLADAPPAAARRPFVRGWTTVAVAAVAMAATLPGRTHGLGMVTERILADPAIGLTRLQYGQLNLWATLVGAAFCLGVGRLIDRIGSRLVLTAVVASLAAAVLGMSLAAGPVAFFVAVTLTRGFGQSALSVVSITLVGKWFRRRLGLAMGVYTVLMSVLFMGLYGALQGMQDADWRTVWVRIAAGLACLVPAFWLLTRDTPEACGLTPDGSPRTGSDEEPADAESLDAGGPSFTLGEALATPAFWVFALGTSAFGLVSAGVSLFNESLFVDLGFDKNLYYEMLKFGVPFGLAANFATGWLANRVGVGKLAAAALLVMAASLAALPWLATPTHVRVYTAVYAASGGAMTVLFFVVWGRLYGRAQLGRIQAAAQMTTVLASALGPVAFAAAKEATGSYAPTLWAAAAVIAALALAAAVVPLPTRPEPSVAKS